MGIVHINKCTVKNIPDPEPKLNVKWDPDKIIWIHKTDWNYLYSGPRNSLLVSTSISRFMYVLHVAWLVCLDPYLKDLGRQDQS